MQRHWGYKERGKFSFSLCLNLEFTLQCKPLATTSMESLWEWCQHGGSKTKRWYQVLMASYKTPNQAMPKDTPIFWTFQLCCRYISFFLCVLGLFSLEQKAYFYNMGLELDLSGWRWMKRATQADRVLWTRVDEGIHGACGNVQGKRVLDTVQNTLQENMCFHFSVCIYLCGQIQWDYWGVACNGKTKVERWGGGALNSMEQQQQMFTECLSTC